MKKHWYHFVAKTHPGLEPFWCRDLAVPLWLRLRRTFQQECLAAVLMPNHIHLLIRSARPSLHKRVLAHQLRAYTRQHFPGQSLWQKIPEPDRVNDRQKLETVIRYIHLNPCRKRYTANPWAWEFSTLQDHSLWVPEEAGLPGPWVSPHLIEQATRHHATLWAERHRAFVRMDPTVAQDGDSATWDLAMLEAPQFQSVLERATCRTRASLTTRGPTRDWVLRVHAQLMQPRLPSRTLALQCGITRQRVGHLRKQELSARVRLYLERLAYLATVPATQRGRNSHSRVPASVADP